MVLFISSDIDSYVICNNFILTPLPGNSELILVFSNCNYSTIRLPQIPYKNRRVIYYRDIMCYALALHKFVNGMFTYPINSLGVGLVEGRWMF